ncbi:hypothetical protein AVEN_41575-1 [Araneus ventricosus]|uniref:Uncharacterized protein n=1 Tax=Araneus ventricosus TaxID=182803 RepID=A0A4Y2VZG8_ARAVE|nr:hypothetical protein AVEN_41575-1 [Araneus ventricosus]
MNTLSLEKQNFWGPTLSLHTQKDESTNPSSINFLTDTLRAPCAKLQHLMHFSHQSSSTERENQSSNEIMLQMQRTAESSEIENQEDQIDFAGLSASASCMSQSVPENFIIDQKVKGTQNKASNSSADPFIKRGNSSTGNFFSEDFETVNEASLQDAHSSKKQTMTDKNYNNLHALLVKRSPSPTSMLVLNVRSVQESSERTLLNAHMQDQ